MNPYFHFLALCSGSGPSHFPLGEIQLTVRHSSQRNKLIVVVHACRYGPMTEMSLFTTLSCSELTSVCFSSTETWSRSPTTAQILTSASTCSLTNGGQAGGKLTPSRKTSTQFTTRRESRSPADDVYATWGGAKSLMHCLLFLSVPGQVWVHRFPCGAPQADSGCCGEERRRSALQTQRPSGKGTDFSRRADIRAKESLTFRSVMDLYPLYYSWIVWT